MPDLFLVGIVAVLFVLYLTFDKSLPGKLVYVKEKIGGWLLSAAHGKVPSQQKTYQYEILDLLEESLADEDEQCVLAGCNEACSCDEPPAQFTVSEEVDFAVEQRVAEMRERLTAAAIKAVEECA